MAQSGRRSDPIPLKLLKGVGKGRDQAGYPVPVAPAFDRGIPDPPNWLSLPALELWHKITPGLDALGLVKPEDYTTLVSYCETWATYLEALEQTRSGGLIVDNPKTGMPHVNPAVKVLEQAGTQMLRFAQEFGLTPVAEVALAKPARDDDAEDPFA